MSVVSYFFHLFAGLVLVLLRLNVPEYNFSVMSGRSHRFLGITCTFWGVNVSFAQGLNTAEVGIEPPTSCSGTRGFTTGPPRSLICW